MDRKWLGVAGIVVLAGGLWVVRERSDARKPLTEAPETASWKPAPVAASSGASPPQGPRAEPAPVAQPEPSDAGALDASAFTETERRVLDKYGPTHIDRAIHELQDAYEAADDRTRPEAERLYFAALNVAPKLAPAPLPQAMPAEGREQLAREAQIAAEWGEIAPDLADELSSKPFDVQEREMATQKRAFYDRRTKELAAKSPAAAARAR